MHGIHDLHEEYKGNVERLGPAVKSVESFRLARAKGPSVSWDSTPLWERIVRLVMKLIIVVLFGLGCFCLMLALGLKTDLRRQLVKLRFSTVTLNSAFLVKRSEIPELPNPKILAASSEEADDLNIQLILPLTHSTNSTAFKSAVKLWKHSDTANTILVSFAGLNETVLPEGILAECHVSGLFEMISFAWCRAFKEHRQYPKRLIIYGAEADELCAIRHLTNALKINPSIISYQRVPDESEFSCNSKSFDVFDCSRENRQYIRFSKSRFCPEMAPLLLACSNHINLNRANAFQPQWQI